VKRPLNWTTKVPVAQTVGELTALLAASGAQAVGTTYDGGRPTGLNFLLPLPYGTKAYALPVDADAMHRRLRQAEEAGDFAAARKARGTFSSREHAERVAWRVVKDWLEAQLALIEAGLAVVDQVMLPYVQVDGRSLHSVWVEGQQKALRS
jgi:hypothetical protein